MVFSFKYQPDETAKVGGRLKREEQTFLPPKIQKAFVAYANGATWGESAKIAGTSTDIGDVQKASSKNALFSDATLTILSNKNNPIVNILFRDLYPVALSALEYTQDATDVEYLTATVDFTYQIYEIETII